MPWGGIVKMSAVRSFIPTTWISIYRIDTERRQLHFEHLRSTLNATRGMIVVWHFSETPEGIQVEITHDLDLHWPLIGGFVGKYIVGLFFIHHIASLTWPASNAKSKALPPDMSRSRVVITGIGALTCIGHGRRALGRHPAGTLRHRLHHPLRHLRL